MSYNYQSGLNKLRASNPEEPGADGHRPSALDALRAPGTKRKRPPAPAAVPDGVGEEAFNRISAAARAVVPNAQKAAATNRAKRQASVQNLQSIRSQLAASGNSQLGLAGATGAAGASGTASAQPSQVSNPFGHTPVRGIVSRNNVANFVGTPTDLPDGSMRSPLESLRAPAAPAPPRPMDPESVASRDRMAYRYTGRGYPSEHPASFGNRDGSEVNAPQLGHSLRALISADNSISDDQRAMALSRLDERESNDAQRLERHQAMRRQQAEMAPQIAAQQRQGMQNAMMLRQFFARDPALALQFLGQQQQAGFANQRLGLEGLRIGGALGQGDRRLGLLEAGQSADQEFRTGRAQAEDTQASEQTQLLRDRLAIEREQTDQGPISALFDAMVEQGIPPEQAWMDANRIASGQGTQGGQVSAPSLDASTAPAAVARGRDPITPTGRVLHSLRVNPQGTDAIGVAEAVHDRIQAGGTLSSNDMGLLRRHLQAEAVTDPEFMEQQLGPPSPFESPSQAILRAIMDPNADVASIGQALRSWRGLRQAHSRAMQQHINRKRVDPPGTSWFRSSTRPGWSDMSAEIGFAP